MSRSNPTETSQNPASRWISWSGDKGVLKYYDKDKKEDVEIGDRFSFLLLDNLASIRGWHEASESGIYSNEVRDTRSDRFTVKAFKGGVLAEGFYADIKDRVNSVGGGFNSNLYIAYKVGSDLKIGAIALKGAALSSWMEFSKANRKAINEMAVQINGSTEGKKGSVKFKTPNFSLLPVTPETNEAAVELDRELQEYLNAYLAKNKSAPREEPEEDEDDPGFQEQKQQREAAAAAAAENKKEWDEAEKAYQDQLEHNKKKLTPDENLELDDIPF